MRYQHIDLPDSDAAVHLPEAFTPVSLGGCEECGLEIPSLFDDGSCPECGAEFKTA